MTCRKKGTSVATGTLPEGRGIPTLSRSTGTQSRSSWSIHHEMEAENSRTPLKIRPSFARHMTYQLSKRNPIVIAFLINRQRSRHEPSGLVNRVFDVT